MREQVMDAASRLLESPWLRPWNDRDAIDDLLSQVDPTWSLGRIRARVVEICDEAPGVRSFHLRPNRWWPGHAAGQHVTVSLEIRGVRHHRTFSLSSAPSDPLLRLTVRRNPAGRVSNAMHDRLAPGDVIELSRPTGEFVWPATLPERLFLLSAGSGITPVASLLRDLRDRAPDHDVVFLHVSRTRADAIFAAELRALGASLPGLRRITHYTSERGRLDAGAIAALVPDRAERHTWLCGPPSFLASVQERWEADGVADRLVSERFQGPVPPARSPGTPVRVRATCSQREFRTTGAHSLLVEAEQAGLTPKHGCRIGICRTCRCRMASGRVENLRTGEIHDEPGEQIQLCVSVARSDLELEL